MSPDENANLEIAASVNFALADLWSGRKRTHWMWFVFPQLAGLGRSPTGQHYASGLAEARAYLAHPVLGPRLAATCRALTGLPASDPVAVLGAIDAVKLRSSMTLFEVADPAKPVFARDSRAVFRRRPGRGHAQAAARPN